MESTLEVIAYALIFRPVQALAIAVFLYHGLAALVRERRRERHSGNAPGARDERYTDPRRLVA
jgi:hypothetical protein